MKFSIVIPFRDRYEHLAVLVPRLRQLNLDLEIIVAEQSDYEPLRRGALRNEGVRVSSGEIVVLHDVDYIPSPDVNYWTTANVDVYRPIQRVEFIQMNGSPRTDTPSGYQTFKDGIDDDFFGGVLCLTKEAFVKCNGYNPMYEGWGKEDEDFRERIRDSHLKIESGNGTFQALPHPDSFRNDKWFRRNQILFMNRNLLKGSGFFIPSAQIIHDDGMARLHNVDKWIQVNDWKIHYPFPENI